MLVINAGANAGHRPPFEFDGEVLIPPSDVADRVSAILSGLKGLAGVRVEEVTPASPADVTVLHDPRYVAFLRDACLELSAGYRADFEPALFASVFPYQPGQRARTLIARMGEYCFDTYTPLMPGTFDAAVRTASAALHSAERVIAGKEAVAYAVGRPPGHHAEHARCGGYSYLNGTALAAHTLAKLGPVAVLDLDVHHGNGTQHLLYERADIRTASIHGDPAGLFPHFSGYVDETGTGAGLGANRNFPLPPGTDDVAYQPVLETTIEWLSQGHPAFLVVALGYDTHFADPIGGFGLTTGYYTRIAATLRQMNVPTVLVQEGGYALDHLGACAAAFVRGWA